MKFKTLSVALVFVAAVTGTFSAHGQLAKIAEMILRDKLKGDELLPPEYVGKANDILLKNKTRYSYSKVAIGRKNQMENFGMMGAIAGAMGGGAPTTADDIFVKKVVLSILDTAPNGHMRNDIGELVVEFKTNPKKETNEVEAHFEIQGTAEQLGNRGFRSRDEINTWIAQWATATPGVDPKVISEKQLKDGGTQVKVRAAHPKQTIGAVVLKSYSAEAVFFADAVKTNSFKFDAKLSLDRLVMLTLKSKVKDHLLNGTDGTQDASFNNVKQQLLSAFGVKPQQLAPLL